MMPHRFRMLSFCLILLTASCLPAEAAARRPDVIKDNGYLKQSSPYFNRPSPYFRNTEDKGLVENLVSPVVDVLKTVVEALL